MSTDSEPEGGSKERNLAAGRADRFSGTAPKPAAAARDRRRRLAKITAASMLAHGCLVLAFVLLDEAAHPPNRSGPAREIPVEVVTEPAAPPSREPPQMPETEANFKPADEAMSGPNPVAMAAAPQPRSTVGPRTLAKPAHEEIVRTQTAHEHRPAARLAEGPRQNGGSDPPMQPGLPLPFDSGPDSFRAVPLPLPAVNGGEAMSYRFIVGGMLERVKHYPAAARQRRAKGIATIRFVLDESGRIRLVSLLRSSGEADLDAESVALVNRAAPFPPPPPGAQDSFAIEVAFGMGS